MFKHSFLRRCLESRCRQQADLNLNSGPTGSKTKVACYGVDERMAADFVLGRGGQEPSEPQENRLLGRDDTKSASRAVGVVVAMDLRFQRPPHSHDWKRKCNSRRSSQHGCSPWKFDRNFLASTTCVRRTVSPPAQCYRGQLAATGHSSQMRRGEADYLLRCDKAHRHSQGCHVSHARPAVIMNGRR